jgi:hypothetical protein
LIIIFGDIIDGKQINQDIILAPSVNELSLKKALKKKSLDRNQN